VLAAALLVLPAGTAEAKKARSPEAVAKKACAASKRAAATFNLAKGRATRKTRAFRRARGAPTRARARRASLAAGRAKKAAGTRYHAAAKKCKKATAAKKRARARHRTRGLLIASFVVFGVILALLWIFGHLVIGDDGRVSTSKTTASTWTALIAASLLAFVIAKLAGYPQALHKLLHSGLAGQYGLLIGGPLGAAVAARGIVGAQVRKKRSAKTPAVSKDKSPAKLIQNDVGETDLGDFQYILFNFVAMVYFVGVVVQSPLNGFPRIPDVLLGLTSVAAVGYVSKKALPPPDATARLDTTSAKVEETVTITGSGLLSDDDPPNTALIVLFGKAKSDEVTMSRSEAVDTITAKVPDGLPDDAVDVFVITPTPARVEAGSFTLKP